MPKLKKKIISRSHLDLHSKILLELAEVLADSRAKATSLDVEKLVNKCPSVPIDEGTDILTKHDAPGLGIMVRPFYLKHRKKISYLL